MIAIVRGTNILMCTVVGQFYYSIENMRKEEIMSEMFKVLQTMYGERAVYPEV